MLISKLKKRIYALFLKKTGVVVISFPKSGRTWLRLLLDYVNIDPDFDHTTSKIDAGCTHNNVCNSIGEYSNRRVVFLTRDPRDTLISYYLQAVSSRKSQYEGSLKEFIRDPLYGIEKVVSFNIGWYKAKNSFKDFICISYEDMQENTERELTNIISFMKIPFITKSSIRLSVENNCFTNMKKKETSGELHKKYGLIFSDGSGDVQTDYKVRSGKVGGYKDRLDDEDLKYCAEIVDKHNYKTFFQYSDK